MTTTDYKVLENRLRRAADRQGFRLERSRTRDPHATDYGTYQLVDNRTNNRVKADWDLQRGYGLGLEDVARFLFEDITVNVFTPAGDPGGPYPDFPFIEYREGSTTRARDLNGRLVPDGWVLNYGDGDEYILGAWDSAEEAVAAAKEHLRRR
jgi:hypothetical protein